MASEDLGEEEEEEALPREEEDDDDDGLSLPSFDPATARLPSDPGSPSATFAQTLRDDKQLINRWEATVGLGSLGASECCAEGADALTDAVNNTDFDCLGLQLQATSALGQIGNAAGEFGALTLARTLLQRGPLSSAHMRMSAANSLGKMPELAEGEGTRALCQALIDDVDPAVRRNAAASLGDLGAEAAGVLGAAALAKALKEDTDLSVRWHAVESIAKLGPQATGAGAIALIKALAEDTSMDVRWRAARSLGSMGDHITQGGVMALVKACHQDKAVIVREQAALAIEEFRNVAMVPVGSVNEHGYIRGRAACALGELADFAGDAVIELLAVTLLQDRDVYVRRRVVEALGRLGTHAGELGVLALSRASVEDEDCFVMCKADEYAPFPPVSNETVERLHRLLGENSELHADEWAEQKRLEAEAAAEAAAKADAERRAKAEADAKAARDRAEQKRQEELAKKRAETARQEELARKRREEAEAKAAARAAAMREAEAQASEDAAEKALQEALDSAKTEEEREAAEMAAARTWADDAGSDFEWDGFGRDLTAEELESDDPPLLDDEKAAQVFHRLAVTGEVSRDKVQPALRLMGHRAVNNHWVQAIIDEDLAGRSYYDQEDFNILLSRYEAKSWMHLKAKFQEADLDGSGEIDGEELTALLDRLEITPATGVVPSLIREVTGFTDGECNFGHFLRIHTIIEERAGFTRSEWKRIRDLFVERSGGDEKGRIGLDDIRGLLSTLGYPTNEEILDALFEWLAEEIASNTVVVDKEPVPAPSDAPADEEEQEQEPAKVTASLPELLSLVRRYREDEAAQIMEAMEKMQGEDAETVGMDQLPELLLDIGYVISERCVVREIAVKCGVAKNSQLTLEDLCAMLEKIRLQAGFSASEFRTIEAAFGISDKDKSSEIVGFELEGAIRYLGYPTSFDAVQEILDEFDVDCSGSLNIFEFVKVIAQKRRQEFDELRKLFPEADKRKQAYTEGLFRKLVICLGHKIDTPFRERLTLDVASSGTGEADLWDLADMLTRFRKGIRTELRQQSGFNTDEVRKYKKAFTEADPDQRGYINSRKMGKMLAELMPDALKSRKAHERLKKIVQEADKDASGRIEFEDFLQLMRLLTDETSSEKLAKERQAAKETGFSITELREFRKVYKMYDLDKNGSFDFDELQAMVAGVIGPAATGHQGTQQLLTIMSETDKDGSHALDFPEFLLLMKRILSENLFGMGQASA